MKESISYSFLLNIVIVFIFTCAAVVAGIFSYYRAFRASTIITNEIEKYEGFNCYSEDAIAKKLQTISYNLPFDATCKAKYGKNCMVDSNKNYVVVAYNLDFDEGIYAFSGEKNRKSEGEDDKYINQNSKISERGHTKKYQYGVYTYMYIDLPIVSNLLKISIFSKTGIMHEFRNLYQWKDGFVMDLDIIPDNIKQKYDLEESIENDDKELVDIRKYAASQILTVYANKLAYKNYLKDELSTENNDRLEMQYAEDASDAIRLLRGRNYCGLKTQNYSMLRIVK